MRVFKKGVLRLVFLGVLSLMVWLGPGLSSVQAVLDGMEGMEDDCGQAMQWMVGWCMGAEAAGDFKTTEAVSPLATAAATVAPYVGGVFTSIDVPGASATRVFGINPEGDIVGSYTDTTGTHGYLLRDGVFTSIDYPGARATEAWGINPRGNIIGRYTRSGVARTFGFLLSDGQFTDISVGNHRHTLPTKIGASNEIVGCFHDTNFLVDMRGYVQRGNTIMALENFSSSMHNGVTRGGRTIVGLVFETATKAHGYAITKDVLTLLDFPGSSFTQAWDVNPHGTIVGQYVDAGGKTHGFFRDESGFVSIDPPGASLTRALGINPEGDIVGVYVDAGGMHGFLLEEGREDR